MADMHSDVAPQPLTPRDLARPKSASEVRLEAGVKQDVVGLDVVADDPGCAVVVEVAESACGLDGDARPGLHLRPPPCSISTRETFGMNS
jgi:hypothetical protein